MDAVISWILLHYIASKTHPKDVSGSQNPVSGMEHFYALVVLNKSIQSSLAILLYRARYGATNAKIPIIL
jgi:hypothetical protein